MFARRQAMVDRGNVVITSSESGSTGRISEEKLAMNPIHRGLMAISGGKSQESKPQPGEMPCDNTRDLSAA
jgi:hypothetical protein